MVTKAPILVVHTVKERMRTRYTVSNMSFLHFVSASRSQNFNQEESTKSIWVPSTIPNQPPLEKKNFPYSCLLTRVCGTCLRYIYACALGLLYKKNCLYDDYKISRRCGIIFSTLSLFLIRMRIT